MPFLQQLARRRLTALTVAALLTGVAGYGASTLRPDYDPRAFHPKANPMVDATRAAEAVFGADDRTALVGLVGEAVFSVEGFAAVDRLTRQLQTLEGVERVTSMTTVRHVEGQDETVTIEPIVGSLPRTPAEARLATEALRADPDVLGSLVAPDGRATLIQVLLFEDWTSPTRRADLHDRIREVLDSQLSAGRSAGVEALLGGFPMVRVQYSREMLAQVGRLLGLACLVLLVALIVVLRSMVLALVTLLVVAVANVWTHGIMGAAGQPFTILAMLTPIIVMVVGVADAVHVIAAYRRSEGERLDRISAALSRTAGPTLLTSLTTAIGFLALLTAHDVPMIQTYGLYTALGVVLAWAATMLLVPPLLALGLGGRSVTPAPTADAWMERRVTAIVQRPLRTIGLSAALVLVAGVFAARISTDASILDGLSADHPIMQTYSELETHFGGSLPMQVIYRDVDPTDPAVLTHIDETTRTLSRSAGVGVVQGPTGLIRRFHQALMGGEASSDRLPDDPAVVGDIFLAASFSDPNPLDGFIFERLGGESAEHPTGLVRITTLLPERGAHATLALQDELLADLQSRPLPSGRVDLGGTAWIAPRAWRVLQRRMAWGLLLGVGIITVLFGILFRSVSVALLSILPNLIPLLVVLAVMSLFGIAAKGNNAVVFSIAYGIAVDDTIHLLAQLRRTSERLPWRDAIVAAHREVRGALTTTSIVLAAGFAVLLTSTFEFTVTLGLQMVVTVFAALLADLFLLPALLALRSARGGNQAVG